jgi:hypothetical protein
MTCSLTSDAHRGEFALGTPPRCDGCVYVLIESRARGVKCLALLKRKPEIILLQAREALAGMLAFECKNTPGCTSSRWLE